MIFETHYGRVELYQELPGFWTAELLGTGMRASSGKAMDALVDLIMMAQAKGRVA